MFTVRKSRGVRVLQKNAREATSQYENWPYAHPVDWSKSSQMSGGVKLGTAANQAYFSKNITQLVDTPQTQVGLSVWDQFYWLRGFAGETLRVATVNMVNASLSMNGRR